MTAPHEGLLISIDYWVAFAIYAVFDRALLGSISPRVHHAITVLVSVFFLWWFTGASAIYLALLPVVLAAIYLAVQAYASKDKHRPGGLALVVGAVGLVWLLGKIGVSLALGSLSWLFALGVSFLLVKIWSFAKDMRDGRVQAADPVRFVAYCLYFPCFVSGPMHFYDEYQKAFDDRSTLSTADVVEQVWRILHGLVKVLVVARVLRPFALEPVASQGLSHVGLVAVLWRSVVYSFVIYLDFSGYSDIVISSAKLTGVEVPENFKLPYLARNLRDFWQRWHITFTRFLTRYLFVPLTRALQQRDRTISPTTLSLVGYSVTFSFCGIWHGSQVNYLAWGIYHGLGLAVFDAFNRRRMAAVRASKKPAPKPTRMGHVFFAGVTFLFVSFGWSLFVLPVSFWSR